MMENVKCNLCNLDDTRVLFSKKDKFRISEEEFNVVECNQCGLLFVHPRPSQEEMARFYPSAYSWEENLEAETLLTKSIRRLERATGITS